MLDVDHGTYPYVTSSNTVSGAVCAGAGVGPGSLRSVIGICKAYTTRVGNGPFPTEERGAVGERLREIGDEFGATTGRPRRCGWFDAVLVRQAARLNGLTGVAITKLDVLTGMGPLRICTAYRAGAERFTRVPASTRLLEQVVPEYEEMPGWTEPLDGARSLSDLPLNARRYVARLEELTATPITMISVGAEREQTIILG
jgi:adenylosuccinate synthase